MSIFGKKKNNSEDKTDTQKTENSTLDLIKETMNEVKKENKEKSATEVPVNISLELRIAITAYLKEKSEENLNKILNCLQNPQTMVTIGAQLIPDQEEGEKEDNSEKPNLDKPVGINPMLLADASGKKVFPVFSGWDAIPENLQKETTKVNIAFANCVDMIKNINDVKDFVLDPYTANIRFSVNINTK